MFVIIGHTLRGCVDWNLHTIRRKGSILVTPYVGVWIETFQRWRYSVARMSHPTWVCGLKLFGAVATAWITLVTPYVGVWIETLILITEDQPPMVTPYVGVWIETLVYLSKCLRKRSHPTWVCGLKQLLRTNLHRLIRSHPTWVCGLKHPSQKIQGTLLVTPYVGVWIETICWWRFLGPKESHTLRGCVDWNALR